MGNREEEGRRMTKREEGKREEGRDAKEGRGKN